MKFERFVNPLLTAMEAMLSSVSLSRRHAALTRTMLRYMVMLLPVLFEKRRLAELGVRWAARAISVKVRSEANAACMSSTIDSIR